MVGLFKRWAALLERLFPDPFTLALLLTLVTLGVAAVTTPHSPSELLGFWGTGMWDFLKFAMQMLLILVTGQALAETPSVSRVLIGLANQPKNQRQGVVLVSFFALVAAWVNWGFGLIVGAILARKVSDQLALKIGETEISRGLIGAAGYCGLAFWHGGISGSAPLKAAEEGHFLEEQIGVLPMSETVFSTPNLLLSVVMMVAVPLFLAGLCSLGPLDPDSEAPAPLPEVPAEGPPAAGERILAVVFALLGAGWFFLHRGNTDPNVINFCFLFLGMLLYGSPKRYSAALGRAIGGVSGIVLQFPFYAGIVAIAAKSGLVTQVSNLFVTVSQGVEAATGFQPFLAFVFFSAGLANLFVPSGGGQWMIQGPIVMEAAQNLGITPQAALMAVAYGDQWTNLLQPFWALPLLSITGLRPAQLISVTTLLLLWMGFLTLLALGILF